MFCFSDVRTSEIKLQLNNAAGGRLKRNSQPRQFYFIFKPLFHHVRLALVRLLQLLHNMLQFRLILASILM